MEIKGVLIDIDGVMQTGGAPVPGAAGTLRYMRDQGIPFRFVSNTTRKCRATIAGTLFSMGIPVDEQDILTPAVAAAGWLSRRGLTSCTVLCCGDMIRDIEAGGIETNSHKPPAVVVGDAGDLFTYEAMTGAFRAVLDGAVLVALEKDRYWMGAGGLMLGAGPYVVALEYAASTTAVLIGKPSEAFFTLALESLGTRAGETAMIGDDVITDTGGAMNAGMKGILVRTGKFREDTLRCAPVRPDAVIGSIADLPAFLGGTDRR